MFTAYILYSEKMDRFYVGFTNNIDRRIAEHNRKKGKYTDRGIPWKIVYTETYPSKIEAQDREKFIKSRKSREYIEGLINPGG